jgi:hypothetical protein
MEGHSQITFWKQLQGSILSTLLLVSSSLSFLPQSAFAADETVLELPTFVEKTQARATESLDVLTQIRKGNLPPPELIDRWGLYGKPVAGQRSGEETDVYIERVLDPGTRNLVSRKRSLVTTDVQSEPSGTRQVLVGDSSDLHFQISDGSHAEVDAGFIEILHTDGRTDPEARHIKFIKSHVLTVAGFSDPQVRNPVYVYVLPQDNPAFVRADLGDRYDETKIYGMWRFQAEAAAHSHARFPLRMHWMYFNKVLAKNKGIAKTSIATLDENKFKVNFGTAIHENDTLNIQVGNKNFSYNRQMLRLQELLRDDLPLLLLDYIAHGKTDSAHKLFQQAQELLDLTQKKLEILEGQSDKVSSDINFLSFAQTELAGFLNSGTGPSKPIERLKQDAFRTTRHFLGSGEVIEELVRIQDRVDAIADNINTELDTNKTPKFAQRVLGIYDQVKSGKWVHKDLAFNITGALLYLGIYGTLIGVALFGVFEFFSDQTVRVALQSMTSEGDLVTKITEITKNEGYKSYSWGQPTFYLDLLKFTAYVYAIFQLWKLTSNQFFGKLKGGLEGLSQLMMKGFNISIRFTEALYTFLRHSQRFIARTPKPKHAGWLPPISGVNPDVEAAKAGFAFRTPQEEIQFFQELKNLEEADKASGKTKPNPKIQAAIDAQDAWLDGEAKQQRLTLAHLHVLWASFKEAGKDFGNPADVLQALHLMNKKQDYELDGNKFSPAELEKIIATYALLLRYDLRYAQGMGATPAEIEATLDSSDMQDVQTRIKRALEVQQSWVNGKTRHMSEFLIQDTRGMSRISNKEMSYVTKSVGYDLIYTGFAYVIARGFAPAALVATAITDASLTSGMWAPGTGLSLHFYQEFLFQFIYGHLYEAGFFQEFGTKSVQKARYRGTFVNNLGAAFLKEGTTFTDEGRSNYTAAAQMFFKVFLIRVMARVLGDVMTAVAVFSQKQSISEAWNAMFDMASWGSYFLYAAPILSILHYLMFGTYYNARNGKLSSKDQKLLFWVYGATSGIAAAKLYHWVLYQTEGGDQFLRFPLEAYNVMVNDIGPMASHSILFGAGIMTLGYFWGNVKGLLSSLWNRIPINIKNRNTTPPPDATRCD